MSIASSLPEMVQRKARSQGPQGLQWLEQLDEQVAALAQAWHLRIGEVLTGGSAALTLHATRHDDTPAVLKLGIPGYAALQDEAYVLKLAQGVGYPELYRFDPDQNALLIERLGAPLHASGLSDDAQLAIACQTLQASWHPIEPNTHLMTGAQKARWLAEFITKLSQELPHACEEHTISCALRYAKAREEAHDPARCVLVHGDPHEDNILQTHPPNADGDYTYKLIDPDGLFAEPAYDLGLLMRSWNQSLLPDPLKHGKQRCHNLHTWTGIPQDAIWQWGLVERVSTGLYLHQLEQTHEAHTTLHIASLWTS